MTSPDINPGRLMRRLRDLSAIGRTPDGGITRPGFSREACDAAAYIAAQASAAGLSAVTDAAGNLLIRPPEPRRHHRTLLAGSHLDTVLNGGWLDGAYGVVAALEVLEVLHGGGYLKEHSCDLAAVAFANEEGAVFPQAFWGSMAMAGTLGALAGPLTGRQGEPLREALARAGGDIDAVATAAWPAESLAGYLELHIEQGPVLETAAVPVGVVEAISGKTVLEVEFTGRAAHAGTTPMGHRADALLGAAHIVVAVSRLPARGLCRVATAGRLDAGLGSSNTITGAARVTIDLRDADPVRLSAAEAAVRADIAAIAAEHDLKPDCHVQVRSAPAATDPRLRRCIADSAASLGLRSMELPSGAGHDAQIMAAVTPAAMIFAPSVGGASHVPHEDTAPEALLAGARVLLGTVLRAACQPRKGDSDAVPAGY